MKKMIRISGLLSLFITSFISGTGARPKAIKQVTLVYDYVTRQFQPIPLFIREGSPVSIRYININPFACKSDVSFTSINYQYTDGADAILKAGGILTPAAVDGAAATVTKAGGKRAAAKTTGQELTRLLKDRDAALESYNGHQVIVAGAIREVQNIMSIDATLQQTAADLTLTSATLMKSALESGMSDNIKTNAANGTLKQYFIERVADINDGAGEMKKDLIKLNRINEALLAADKTYAFTDQLRTMQASVTAIDDAYHGENYKTLEKNVTAITNNLAAAYRAKFIVDGNKTAIATADILVFGDQLLDRNNKELETHKDISLYTFGGWRLNTSIGIATTFGAINGSEYNLKKNPSGSALPADTGMVTLEGSSKNRKAAFNPVLFFHYYPTLNSFVSWRMISLGIGPDFSDLNKSKLYLGTGVGFTPSASGSINIISRIGLDAGIVLGYADVLKAKYDGYTNYAQFAGLTNADLTDRTIKAGFYCALSFNLAPVKKQDKSETK